MKRPAPSPDDLRAQASRLRAEIRDHKRNIRHHRHSLSVAAEHLASIERQLRASGQAFDEPQPQEA